MIHLRAGRTAAALADLKEAIPESESPLRHLHYALALCHDDKFDHAIVMLEKARSLGLNRETLHPLEQVSYDDFVKVLHNQTE